MFKCKFCALPLDKDNPRHLPPRGPVDSDVEA